VSLTIRNTTRGTVLATSATVAGTSETRRTGLLKHTSLPRGEGLLIAPCEGIHTFGMKFAIDVLFLSRERKVLKAVAAMGPRRISLCLRAHSVLELPVGAAAETGTVKGDQLEFEEAPATVG
jgi:uncharacterized membrane protein (UPF0127 family)